MKEIKPEKKVKLYQRHPIIFGGCVLIEALAFCVSILLGKENFITGFITLNLFAVPAILSFINVSLVFIKPKSNRKWKIKVRYFEIISMLTGFILSTDILDFGVRYVDWHTQIAIGEYNSPIWIHAIPTVVV